MSDLILFDIDGTLFDPKLFGQQIRAEFIKILNIEEDELISANADYYANLETSTDFNPRDIVSFLSARYGVGKEPLDRIFWENTEIYKESFYPEVEEVLKKLSKNHTLGIFSQGNPDLQIRKLVAGGVRKYFKDEYMLIYTRKMTDEAIASLPRESTIIDNRHDVALKLTSFANVVWINRNSHEPDPEMKTIYSLSELIQ